MITMRQIIETVRAAGRIMLEAKDIQTGIEEKEGHANFVTAYDKQVQEFLKGELLRLQPGAVFVGEEEERHEAIDKGYAFIADPIDGTTNFMKGYCMSAVSVGLLKDKEPVMGAVYNPYLNEVFYAEKGKGARCNDRPIHVSGKPLREGIVLVGTAPYHTELADKTFEMMRGYFDRCLDIRRSGSAALDLCSVAAGRAELFFELLLQPWDYAAGSLIVREAGGTVTTAEGEPLRYDRPVSVLASGCRE